MLADLLSPAVHTAPLSNNAGSFSSPPPTPKKKELGFWYHQDICTSTRGSTFQSSQNLTNFHKISYKHYAIRWHCKAMRVHTDFSTDTSDTWPQDVKLRTVLDLKRNIQLWSRPFKYRRTKWQLTEIFIFHLHFCGDNYGIVQATGPP
jgi:hypothetical protein